MNYLLKEDFTAHDQDSLVIEKNVLLMSVIRLRNV